MLDALNWTPSLLQARTIAWTSSVVPGMTIASKRGLKSCAMAAWPGPPGPGIQVDGVVRDVLRPDDGLEGLIVLFR